MTTLKIRLPFIVMFAVAVAAASVAFAADVEVRGDGDYLLDVQNTSTSSSTDKRAVYGKSTTAPGYGYGGEFKGGNIGVKASATMTGSGSRYGIKATASGGSPNYGIHAFAPTGTGNYAGYFDGNVYTTGSYLPSDEDLKEEIYDLDGSLDQVMELEPKVFSYRTEEFPEMGLPEGYHMGLLAQDLQQVLPELVVSVPVPESEADKAANKPPESFLGVNYVELIPVLIAAIQEQQWQIEDLQYQVASLTRK